MILHGLEKIPIVNSEMFMQSFSFQQSFAYNWVAMSMEKTHQDINQAHLNIHASKVNVLILLLSSFEIQLVTRNCWPFFYWF